MSHRLTTKVQIKPFAVVYILFIFMFVLPFCSFENYSILKNTTSHLGAQNTPNAWVMNSTFVLLGLSSLLAGWKFLDGYWLHRIVLILFSVSLVLVAIFQHAPIDGSVDFRFREDAFHSLFAKTTGWTFTLLAIAMSFIAVKRSHKIWALGIAVIGVILYLLMFNPNTAHLMGVWQRVMFILLFGWMLYAFSYYKLKEIDNQ